MINLGLFKMYTLTLFSLFFSGLIRFHDRAASVPRLAFRKHWLLSPSPSILERTVQRKSMALLFKNRYDFFFFYSSLWKKCVLVFLMKSKEGGKKEKVKQAAERNSSLIEKVLEMQANTFPLITLESISQRSY